MTEKTKQRMMCALTNASEMIRGHVEVGLLPEDVNEDDEKGLAEYRKATLRAAKMISKLAEKYRV